MSFYLTLKKGNLESSVESEVTDQLYTTEKAVAKMRILIIVFNILVYQYFLPKTYCIDWLVWTVFSISLIYAVAVFYYQPYKKHSLLKYSVYTSFADGLYISLWIYATGAFNSPFYPLWYASIIAIAMRYCIIITLRTAVIYSSLNVAITLWGVGYQGHETDLLIKTGYLFLIGVAVAYMSKEIMAQIEAKIVIQKSQSELRQREQELKESQNLLEERVKNRTHELNEKNKELKTINEDLDSFVYSASHDLKTPLINIEALLDIMEEEMQQKHEKEKVKEKLLISLERMKSTINKLTEVAKAQKEIYDDINHIIYDEIYKEVYFENEEVIKKSNAIINTYFKESPSIYISRLCIKSILYNLLSNAIKYSSTERPLEINLYTQSVNGYHFLYIKDNGLGIDLKRNRKKIFTIFKRFHDHVEGTGVGLHMVKRMVEKFGGTIDVESEPDKGAMFIIKFREQ